MAKTLRTLSDDDFTTKGSELTHEELDTNFIEIVNEQGSHESDQTNPHSVTKTQVGLGNVPNTDATQRSNHTGTQTASTISDFDEQIAQTVEHGSTASTARPTTSSFVIWIGSVEPTNMQNGDIWLQTSGS